MCVVHLLDSQRNLPLSPSHLCLPPFLPSPLLLTSVSLPFSLLPSSPPSLLFTSAFFPSSLLPSSSPLPSSLPSLLPSSPPSHNQVSFVSCDSGFNQRHLCSQQVQHYVLPPAGLTVGYTTEGNDHLHPRISPVSNRIQRIFLCKSFHWKNIRQKQS